MATSMSDIFRRGYDSGIDPLKSQLDIPESIRRGQIALAFLGLLSLCLTGGVLAFIFYRIFNTKRYHAAPLRYNQSLILITNLLLADFQQALSFTLSLRWIKERAILAPTVTCNAQGWLIQIGDLSSGIFSLAIALQTFSILVLRKHLPYGWFVAWVIGLWVFCVTVSLIGPLTHIKDGIFIATGVWCWMAPKYTTDRLVLHYLWIFICEFGSLFLYAIIFWSLRRNAVRNASQGVRNQAAQRVARLMLLYPVAYTCLTLPLAAGRMASQSGRHVSDEYFAAAGACMASCGWIDVILYTITRRTIVFQSDEPSHHSKRDNNNIPLPAMQYGNSATIGVGKKVGKGTQDSDSATSSQENIVKLEQVVQVTSEKMPTDSSEHRIGNSATAHGSAYW